jgi:hypothetical protein
MMQRFRKWPKGRPWWRHRSASTSKTDVNAALMAEPIFENLTSQKSRFIGCFGFVHRNFTYYCPWGTGIPQSVCTPGTKMSEGKVLQYAFRIFSFMSSFF